MKREKAILFCIVLLCFSVAAQAQNWSGIIDPKRAIDWSQAGIPGGLPDANWTQCGSTIAAYSGTAAAINNQAATCGAQQYVLLGPGTFNLSTAIAFNSKSNFVLRGSGANSTFLVFGAGAQNSCFGLFALVCLNSSDSTYANGGPTVYNWTAGYAQGSSQITLSSTANINLRGATELMLDQCEDGYAGSPCSGASVDNGNFFACADHYNNAGPTGCSANGPDNENRPHRSQIEIVTATAINGNVVTITPPLKAPNWRSGQNPQVWIVQTLQRAGIENLSIDASAAPPQTVITLYNCYQCWVSGVRVVNAFEWPIRAFQSSHTLVQNNYFFGARYSDPYGVDFNMAADVLVQNNIFQQIRSPIVFDGPDSGSVIAYNFTINDLNSLDSTYFFPAFWNHSSGIDYNLWEGNIGGGFTDDGLHGSHLMITKFRNYFTGWEEGNTQGTNALGEWAYSRYANVIGNVLGTAGYHTVYQDSTQGNTAIYQVGTGNGGTSPAVPIDPVTGTTLMRWGNYDVVTSAVRWCVGSTAPCTGSEVPSGINPYPNPVPSDHNLPASFYLPSKPSWFGSLPWPAIGPDVSGGNLGLCSGGPHNRVAATSNSQCAGGTLVTSLGGHANTNPAMNCYLNIMGGPPGGTGSVMAFDPNACYGSAGPPPAPPTGLSAVVQ